MSVRARPVRVERLLLSCALAAALGPAAAGQPATFFLPLGDAPGGPFDSRVLDMTPDGSVVVGTGNVDAGPVPLRWRVNGTAATLEVLSDLPGGLPTGEAVCVNATGTVVGGLSSSWNSVSEATCWGPDSQPNALGDFEGGHFLSIAQGSSADGSVMVGAGHSATGFRACRWRGVGPPGDLGLPDGFAEAQAADVTPDGSVIVGSVRVEIRTHAFRYTDAAGYTVLPDFDGGFEICEAQAISADGRTTVGYAVDGAGFHASLWSAAAGLRSLGDLPGGPLESYARDVSADGAVIVGFGTTADGYEAFVWSYGQGMRSLRDVLVASGVDMTGWYPVRAQAVSADGTLIAGSAINPQGATEAFLARIPPAPVSPDWDRSGHLSFEDVFAYLADWFAGNADYDGSGQTDLIDLFEFVSAWFDGS